MTSACAETKRARPLLGTLVEITIPTADAELAPDAISHAFAAVERVQRLMSFHDPASEVSQLNRLAARQPVEVSAWTFQVLLAAQQLSIASAGAFDITVAPLLQRWGYLPLGDTAVEPRRFAPRAADIELLPAQRVRFHRPLQIDLGGIAKGFAVDQAVAELQAAGVRTGLVNAGGDLRAFGPSAPVIHVRHPATPGRAVPLLRLSDAALATSALYFSRKHWRNHWVSPLVDPHRQRACTRAVSVSVCAPTCLVADALTKVLLVRGRRSTGLLQKCGASAFILTRQGDLHTTDSSLRS